MKLNLTQARAITVSFSFTLLVAAVFLASRSANPRASRAPRLPATSQNSAQARDAYGRLPLSFEPNRGQADKAINFLARGAGYEIALSPNQASFALARAHSCVPDTASGIANDIPVLTAAVPPAVLRMN